MIDFVPKFPYYKGNRVAAISHTANGCFALLTTKGECYLFDANGIMLTTPFVAKDAKILNDGSYFLQNRPTPKSPRYHSYLASCPIWTLHQNDHTPWLSEIDDCKVFANDWYSIRQNDRQQLYNSDHILVAENFKDCAVFPSGYALRTNEIHYLYANWKIFSNEGELIGHCNSVRQILGDGLMLVFDPETGYNTLKDIKGNKDLADNIVSYKTFPNGCFSLTFEEKWNRSQSSSFHGPDGKRRGVATENSVYLPDSRSIGLINKRIVGLYRPTGIITKQTADIWKYVIAGSYYLLCYENGTTLYNDQSVDLGENYSLIATENNFAVFQNEETYHLFNQNGEVISLPLSE